MTVITQLQQQRIAFDTALRADTVYTDYFPHAVWAPLTQIDQLMPTAAIAIWDQAPNQQFSTQTNGVSLLYLKFIADHGLQAPTGDLPMTLASLLYCLHTQAEHANDRFIENIRQMDRPIDEPVLPKALTQRLDLTYDDTTNLAAFQVTLTLTEALAIHDLWRNIHNLINVPRTPLGQVIDFLSGHTKKQLREATTQTDGQYHLISNTYRDTILEQLPFNNTLQHDSLNYRIPIEMAIMLTITTNSKRVQPVEVTK